MEKNNFGIYLRKLRKKMKFSLREIAEYVNCSTVYISDIERAQRKPPSPEIIRKLSIKLKTDFTSLLQKAYEEKGSFVIRLEGKKKNHKKLALEFAALWEEDFKKGKIEITYYKK